MKEYAEIVRLLVFALFTAYVIGVRKYNLDSISQSDYKLKNFRFMFELVMFASGGAIAFSSYGTDIWLASTLLIAGGTLIAGVGIFPKYRKNEFNRQMHGLCAIGGFMLSLAAVYVMFWPLGLLVTVVYICTHLVTKDHDNHTLSIELVLAYGIFISLQLISYM